MKQQEREREVATNPSKNTIFGHGRHPTVLSGGHWPTQMLAVMPPTIYSSWIKKIICLHSVKRILQLFKVQTFSFTREQRLNLCSFKFYQHLNLCSFKFYFTNNLTFVPSNFTNNLPFVPFSFKLYQQLDSQLTLCSCLPFRFGQQLIFYSFFLQIGKQNKQTLVPFLRIYNSGGSLCALIY